MTRHSSFAYSSPAPLRTYSDLLAARAQTVSQISEDISIHNDARRQELQRSLESLVFQINGVQSQFSTDQRQCLVERERLATELARLKVSEEMRRKEATIAHLAKLGEARAGHAHVVAELSSAVPPERDPPALRHSTPAIDEARETLAQFEQSLRSLRRSSASDPPSGAASELTATFLESKRDRDAATREVKLSEVETQKKLVTMVVALDDHSIDHQKEVAEFDQARARREKEYEHELRQLLAQLAAVQQRRRAADEKRRESLARVETEIAAGQSDFEAKLRDARQLAERLRARLANAKIRKEESLRVERQRSDERTRSFREHSDLLIRASELEGEVGLAKEGLAGLRRELTAAVGARRAQSLFI
jgi:hypothetical protein